MNIKAERLNRGLSVNDAAEAIDVPTYVLRNAERGTCPRPESAKKIADFYGVAVTDIWPIKDGVAA